MANARAGFIDTMMNAEQTRRNVGRASVTVIGNWLPILGASAIIIGRDVMVFFLKPDTAPKDSQERLLFKCFQANAFWISRFPLHSIGRASNAPGKLHKEPRSIPVPHFQRGSISVTKLSLCSRHSAL